MNFRSIRKQASPVFGLKSMGIESKELSKFARIFLDDFKIFLRKKRKPVIFMTMQSHLGMVHTYWRNLRVYNSRSYIDLT